jgi:hypothetical protein
VCPHPHPGVFILDIKNPANPTVVGEIGPPFAGVPGITTRELRVWPEKKLLMIMTFHCSSFLHACIPGATPFEIKFFDLKDPRNPPDPSAVPFNCFKNCPNAHSAVKVPGRPLIVMIDEVYGTFTDPSFGCPWGWERLIDISDPTHPSIIGEYKIAQNQQSFCGSPADDSLAEGFTSFSTHNPTVLRKLVIDDWHSGGVQVSDISDPIHPVSAGVFSPKPLASVAIEDPALGRGPTKVIMWSYPIIKDGLIYVIDIRNGLYILRYTGPHSDEVEETEFLEGNSSIGSNHEFEEEDR